MVPVCARSSRPLTGRQDAALGFIRQSIRDRGYPPTLRELAALLGIRSTNGVNDHLRALERKGFITRTDLHSRAIRLVGEGAPRPATPAPPVPVEGTAPRVPLLSARGDLTERTVQIPTGSTTAPADFAFVMTGEGLLGEGILAGDVLYARRPSGAPPLGRVVLALVDDALLVRGLAPAGVDYVQLRPANARWTALLVRTEDFLRAWKGTVVGLYRPVR